MSIEVMKQALEALEELKIYPETPEYLNRSKAITSLRQAIREHALHEVQRLGQEIKQEPVAWKHDCAALLQNNVELWIDRCPHCGKPRTTHPPQRKPLTDTEISLVAHNEDPEDWNSLDFRECWHEGFVVGFRAAEECHKIGV